MSATTTGRPYVETRTAYVYRLFDADGGLLYIGSSINCGARFTRHRADQPWWPQVASWTLEDRPSLDEARTAERIAIAAEHPRHNKIRYDGEASIRLVADELWRDFGAYCEEKGTTRSDDLRRYMTRQVQRWKRRSDEPGEESTNRGSDG